MQCDQFPNHARLHMTKKQRIHTGSCRGEAPIIVIGVLVVVFVDVKVSVTVDVAVEVSVTVDVEVFVTVVVEATLIAKLSSHWLKYLYVLQSLSNSPKVIQFVLSS